MKKGRTEKILELHRSGMPNAQIARELECSPANVCTTIKRYRGWSGYVSHLSAEQREWLVREAERHNVEPSLMARAILSDAIEDAMAGNS